jgi:ADP-ribosyl-[dinitrogen reductase] hydrolase
MSAAPSAHEASARLDRAVGALLGLATGDAVGTTLEFERPGTFTPIDDMVGGGPFRLAAGAWTDDTSMALCLAESLLDRGGMDLHDHMRRYAAWRRDGYLSSTGRCFDIGTTTATQIDRFERTGEPVDPHVDEDAAANGSIMRLAPVAIRWHADADLAADRSAESSRTTHTARRPVDCCRVLGRMLAELIAGRDFATATDPVRGERHAALHPEVDRVAAGSWRASQPPAIRGSGYCVASLEAALWAVGGANDFRDAVLRAANLGDDADTTAAIAGQLAGARWGASAIPAAWRSKLAMHDRIVSLATALATRAHSVGTSAGDAEAGTSAPLTPRWVADPTLHAWWVEPGRVLAGEYPGDPDAAKIAGKVDLLLDAGVRTIVDLTTPEDRLTPYAPMLDRAARMRGLTVERIAAPIPDMGVLPDRDYDPILHRIRAAASSSAVYVHCWGGIGRTGTVVGCLLVDGGLSGPAAIARIEQLRAGTRKSDRRAPQTDQQCDVVIRRGATHGQR